LVAHLLIGSIELIVLLELVLHVGYKGIVLLFILHHPSLLRDKEVSRHVIPKFTLKEKLLLSDGSLIFIREGNDGLAFREELSILVGSL